ncbi:MAG: glycosyltransferase family 39 protein [Actinobacteria bacterium]|nr:glycosyltransferase family 39 protein [Actinomycetota bacterium]
MNVISKNKILIWVTLILILLFAGTLRIYKLGEIPPPLNWDEAANGYNAFTIANFGRDEYGARFPLTFKSFGDDKRPLHIYLTAIFVKFLGLSEFSIRLPAAIFGLLDVVIVFLLGRCFFKSLLAGVIGASFLAISPYALQYSRFSQELVFTMFFFMTGILMFIKGIERKNKLLSLSFLSLGISLFGYHSALVVVPPMIAVLIIIYFKDLMKVKKKFLLGLVFLAVIISQFILNPALLGTARVKQTGFSLDEIQKTQLYLLTKNELLGRVDKTFDQYLLHYSWDYLFVSGDKNARHSTQAVGEFYKIDALFLIIGLLALLWKRSKVNIILLSWALLGPLPAAAVNEAPHASRAMFMFGSWHLIAAYGLLTIINLAKGYYFKVAIILVTAVFLTYSLATYLMYYYGDYSKKYAIEWQYGMKDIVEFVKAHPEYSQTFMTEDRHQPYIFFLFYLKTPLPEYLNTVVYNRSDSRSYSMISYFDKYYFGGWDPIESMPQNGVLYILTPSQYGGLRHRLDFDIKKIVYYPNDSTAFYLVSTK